MAGRVTLDHPRTDGRCNKNLWSKELPDLFLVWHWWLKVVQSSLPRVAPARGGSSAEPGMNSGLHPVWRGITSLNLELGGKDVTPLTRKMVATSQKLFLEPLV